MHIQLHSTLTTELNRELASHLMQQGYTVEQHAASEQMLFELRYGAGTALENLYALEAQLEPFTPAWREDPELLPNSVVLQLTSPVDEEAMLQLCSDTDDMVRTLHHQLEHLGLTVHETKLAYYEQAIIVYSHAMQFAAQQLAFWARLQGLPAQLLQLSNRDEQSMAVYFPDPRQAKLPALERFAVEIVSDAPEQAAELQSGLKAAGFAKVVVVPATKPLSCFQVKLGPLRSPGFVEAKADLLQVVTKAMSAQNVDMSAFRLKIKRHKTFNQATSASIRIDYPLAAMRQGTLAPYSGDSPKRLSVTIKTDEPAVAAELSTAMQAAGFYPPKVEVMPMPDAGFVLETGDADATPLALMALRQCATNCIEACLGLHHSEFSLVQKQPPRWSAFDKKPDTAQEVTLYLPALGSCREERLQALAQGAGCRLVILSPTPDVWQTKLFAGTSFHFQQIEYRHQEMAVPKLQYGAARVEVLAQLKSHCQDSFAMVLDCEQSWGEDDMDVYLHLPAYRDNEEELACPVSALPEPALVAKARPFVVCDGDLVKVGEQVLLADSAFSRFAPSLRNYDHFCVDQPTANTLLFIAQSAAMQEPCLLQGPTAVSKTSAIFYVAACLNKPVIRVNLSVQTEVQDLLGRFVPAAGSQVTPPFIWQDGPVLQAMKQGAWLVLDEVNLASAAVLERFNGLLEPDPSLTLYESDNTVQVAKDGFMVFATMNPGHYAGRQVLSDAWLDRFSCLQIDQPCEQDMTAMITQWVSGKGPAVSMGQWQYQPTEQSAVLGAVQCCESDAALWQALAQFHLACQQLDAEAPLGSRRLLWRVLKFTDDQVQTGTALRPALSLALQRYYFARLSPDAKQTAYTLMQSLHLLPVPEGSNG